MKHKSGVFGHGYRLFGSRGGATLHIQRDLTTGELALLDTDLRLLSGSIVRARPLRVHLEVPLSASLASALEDLTQRYELLTTVSVPPIRHWVQPPLAEEMLQPSKSWLHVVLRQEESPPTPATAVQVHLWRSGPLAAL